MEKKKVNKHGLPRRIPPEIKRQIRKNAGFGCVICGNGITEYEHVDPEYHDAKEHDPEKMTLLCGNHHNKVTRGMLSKDTVKAAMLNPICKQQGFSNDFFDFGLNHPTILIGGNIFKKVYIPVIIKSAPLFIIKPPEEKGASFNLSCYFWKADETDSLIIEDNEWKAGTNNWDVEVMGNRITVREKSGKIHLCLAAYPPEGLVLEKLDTVIHGLKVIANQKKLEVIDGFKNKIYDGSINFSGNEISETPVGFNYLVHRTIIGGSFLIQMILIFLIPKKLFCYLLPHSRNNPQGMASHAPFRIPSGHTVTVLFFLMDFAE